MSEYERGFADGLQAAWDEVNQWIRAGHMESQSLSDQRNGMVMASNQISQMIVRLTGQFNA